MRACTTPTLSSGHHSGLRNCMYVCMYVCIYIYIYIFFFFFRDHRAKTTVQRARDSAGRRKGLPMAVHHLVPPACPTQSCGPRGNNWHCHQGPWQTRMDHHTHPGKSWLPCHMGNSVHQTDGTSPITQQGLYPCLRGQTGLTKL